MATELDFARSVKRTMTKEEEEQEEEQEMDMTRNGVCLHWDKDKDLRLLMDEKFYIHPHISTVMHLSNIGAPTVALNYRINTFTGDYILSGGDDHQHGNRDENGNNNNNNNNNRGNGETTVKGYVSWPKKGKHLSFDGRFLYATPSDFMKRGLFEEQIKVPPLNDKEEGEEEYKGQQHRQQQRQQQHMNTNTHRHGHTQKSYLRGDIVV